MATPGNIASQPGATTPTQPGTTPGAQPGATMPPMPGLVVAPPSSPEVMDDQAAPSTDYAPSRPAPKPRYMAPLNVGQLHAPTPTQQVAPVVAPPNMVRVGEFTTPTPSWMPANVRDQINTQAAGVESNVVTQARSIGITPARSDHFATGLVAGAGLGVGVAALAGATVLGGIPVGAAIGGTVGGLIGLAAGGGVTLGSLGLGSPLLLVGPLIGTAAGIAVGVAAGAVVSAIAIPVAVLAIPIGATAGMVAGIAL